MVHSPLRHNKNFALSSFNVFWQKHNSRIEGFTIRHQAKDGVNINQSNQVTVRDNRFEYCVETGLHMAWNSADQVLENNTFHNMLNSAIVWNSQWDTSDLGQQFDVGDSRIHGNTIENTALVPGYARSGQTGTAIRVFGSDVRITENRIENTGYNGIFISRGGHTVARNTVRRSCLTLNDGGSIYIQSHGNRIASNFFSGSVGNVESAGAYDGWVFRPIAMGVYFEGGYGNSVVEGNTTRGHASHGVYVDLGVDNQIRDNVCYNNAEAQLQFSGNDSTAYNSVTEGNTFCSLNKDQACLALFGADDHGSFDRNNYYNAEGDIVIRESAIDYSSHRYYSLPDWQSSFPSRDPNSKTSDLRYFQYEVESASPNLISNSEFDLGVSEWYSNDATLSHSTSKPEMDGGCLRVDRTGESVGLGANEFPLQEGEVYRLRFSAAAEDFQTLRVRFYDESDSTGWIILDEKHFALKPERGEYTMIFESPVDTTTSRPWFNTGPEVDVYWLDNVTFEPVTATPVDVRESCRLLENPTSKSVTIGLDGSTYLDLDGNRYTGTITLEPFTSKVLLRQSTMSFPTSLIHLR